MEIRYSTRDVLRIAVPIFLEQILKSLMGTVNTFMVSRISDSASAAVGVTSQILNVVMVASFMMSTGTAILENQMIGAGRKEDTARLMMNSIALSAMIGAAVSAATVIFSRQLVHAMGLAEELVADGEVYLRTVGLTCMFQFVSAMVSTHLRCHGKAVEPLIVIIVNNVINFAGCLMVLEGWLPFEGVRGIGVSRFAAETCGVILIIIMFMRQKWGQKIRDLFLPDGRMLGQLLKYGLMSGTEGICYMTAQLVTTRFITGFPTAVLSAKVYTQSVNNYAYMSGNAIGQAAQIVSGQYIGAGKKEDAYRFIRRAWVAVFVMNIIGSSLFLLFSDSIIGIFTESAEIKSIAKTLFLVDIITCAGRSMNHSFNFGLRSSGHVFWPMLIAAVSIWTFDVGLGYLLAIVMGIGVTGIWIAQATDEWIRGLLAAFQWEKKLWMKGLDERVGNSSSSSAEGR